MKRLRGAIAKEPPAITQANKKLNPAARVIQTTKENKEILEKEREKRLKEQREAIAAIRYQPTHFDQRERKYFEAKPTKITNYLFLGTYTSIKNKLLLKTRYGITHIINCTKKENYYSEHFEYMNPPIPAAGDEATIIDILPDYFEFVRKAGKKQGRILVVSDENTGSGVALVLGFLMDNQKLGFFEAFQIVQSKRYVMYLEATYIQQLIGWEKKSQMGTFKEVYQCLCGANVWTLLLPFDNTEHQNPITCGCQIGESYSSCPNHGCGTFCNEMVARMEGKYSELAWNMRYLHWGHTTKDNIQGIFVACEEHTPWTTHPLDAVERAKIEEKSWKVYKCRHCLFLCYAENTKEGSMIAIVTNFQPPKNTKM